jgi:glycosyltransferase involved in cell wall biosynthesis
MPVGAPLVGAPPSPGAGAPKAWGRAPGAESALSPLSSQLRTPHSALRTPNSAPAPLIAVVARLQAHKGHEDLLRCLPGLWNRFPTLRVLLAGQGPHEAHLRAVAQEVGADGRVLFLGHCADVRPVLAAANLFVLPSHREGLPNAVLEAMAVGVPVVAAAADGTGEVVLDGETGLLTPPGDVAALGAAITRLLQDAPLRERLVEGAKRRLEEQFSLPRAVEQVEALLQAIGSSFRPGGTERI